MTQRRVHSADGTALAVYEDGNPDGPTVVLVHGWPDSHVLWDGVVPLLADRFRIIRYDNRGVGGSDVPQAVSAYTMARYADDFAAVTAAVSPGAPVHVLAHDWGSIGMWEYLARPEAGARVASFTSVSGPSADHVNRFAMTSLKRPYRPKPFFQALDGMARLAYMGAFSTPVLGAAWVRLAFGRGFMRRQLLRDGIARESIHHSDTFVRDAVSSMKVYPANYFRSLAGGRTDHYVGIPVQLIVNADDPFIRPYVFDAIAEWVPQLWRRDLKAGHWAPMSHPHVLARAVGEFVDHLDGAPAARDLARARVGGRPAPFAHTLVSVTGAGSGIGRATAQEFASQGAEVVVSDIDHAAAKETAELIAGRGGVAYAYHLDVADAEAVARFADAVCAEHGVPDILVNNAGVGHGGNFLDTPAAQYDWVMDINLGGVVNCCRAFAAPMVARGTGGHVVNVASMAAYTPAGAMNAYATSKAAVFMFSDCLRAELDSAGIGVTTLCPGVIDTNIVDHTRFDVPAAKQGELAAKQVQIKKAFAARRYGPDKVARAIVSAVQNNQAIRPVTTEAHLAYGLSRVVPGVLRRAARSDLL